MNIESLFSAMSVDNSAYEEATFDNLLSGLRSQSMAAEHKPAAPKPRIRAYSPEYWEWLGVAQPVPAVEPEPAVEQIVPAIDTVCSCCKGTGVYVGRTYQTRCARCKGDGILQPGHIKAFATWQSARAAGMPRVVDNFGAQFNLQ
ncbi:cytochrome c5 [Oceanisphaera litoralis]|uniref:hypothetical protein n=1 Tax=Oceanisphaera litoralis TaxID=225144 RepID=UPI001958DF44|nr:hypothetical protein [Oceanisphaera litoralis]MBM7454480.1 cytochrome c5 [Oceanisphaera litoralis]